MFRSGLRSSIKTFASFSRRSLATQSFSRTGRSAGLSKYGAGVLALTMAGAYFARPIENDSKVGESLDTIVVDSSIDPFPTTLTKGDIFSTNYELLGHGMRSVTFIGFNVYGIALYVAKEDVNKAHKILSKYPDLSQQLEDPEKSTQVVDDLLQNGVKFTAKICPVRNTDFNHMKDGFVKSILAHTKSKEQREQIDNGIQQLRAIFQTRKGTVPKNHNLYLQILNGGAMSITYENTKTGEITKLGTVEEPLISNVLFLLYMSGKKPLSQPLRASCASKLAVL